MLTTFSLIQNNNLAIGNVKYGKSETLQLFERIKWENQVST